MSDLLISAILDRVDNSTPWGFRLQGGKDFSSPLTIARVTPGSLAEKCGLLTGDVIKKISNKDTSVMKHKDAQDMIIRSGNKVEFILQRDGVTGLKAPPSGPAAYQSTYQAPTQTYNTAAKPFSSVDSVTSQTSSMSINNRNGYASPSESARYQEPDADGTPKYRGFTDPNLQSRSFSALQNVVQSGQAPCTPPPTPAQPVQGVQRPHHQPPWAQAYNSPPMSPSQSPYQQSQAKPQRFGQQPQSPMSPQPSPMSPSQSQPRRQSGPMSPGSHSGHVMGSHYPQLSPKSPSSAHPVSKPTFEPVVISGVEGPPDHPHVKAVVHAQFNSPMGLYSANNIQQTYKRQVAGMQQHSSKGAPQSLQTGHTAPPSKPFSPPVAKPASGPAPVKWQPTRPVGPRKPTVGKRGAAQFKEPVAGSVKIPVCSSCGSPIRGPFVLALGKSWCPDHFVCANPNCGTKLIDIGFVEEAGQLYCERDYAKFFAPECGSCKQPIVGDTVNALDKQWHPQCFVCTQCRAPITSGNFHVENGMPYCENDWFSLFQTKCHGCDFPIEPGDRCVEAIGKNWHSECFNCATCQVNLEGKPFVPKVGRPYCQKHAR